MKNENIKFSLLKIYNEFRRDYDYNICAYSTETGMKVLWSNIIFANEAAAYKYILNNREELIKKFKKHVRREEKKREKQKVSTKSETSSQVNNQIIPIGNVLVPRNINGQLIELPADVIVDPTPINKIEDRKEKSKNNSHIVLTALGLTAFLGLGAYVLGNSKYDGCIACGIKKTPDDSNHIEANDKTPKVSEGIENMVTETPTNVPTIEPTSTPENTPAPTEDPISVAYIEGIAKEVLLQYQNKNININNSIDIINEDGELVNFELEENDIKNAITILNCDELSQEHYPTFVELVKGKETDGFYQRNEQFMCSIMMRNMQNYYKNQNTENFICFSPLLLNENDKKEVEKLEGMMLEILHENLKYDAVISQDYNNPAIVNVQKLVGNFINEIDSNVVNRKSTNGMYHIIALYCDFIENTCQNTINPMQEESMLLASLQDIEKTYQKSAYVGTMKILNIVNIDNYGCYNDEDKYKLTRHL